MKIPFSFNKLSIESTPEWKVAERGNEAFLHYYKNQLNNLEIGASFSPEYCNSNAKNRIHVISSNEVLEYCVKELKIKEIRFGIRWNNAIDEVGHVDITNYSNNLQTLFDLHAKVTLNVGPIKTFRWPEQYVPDTILKHTYDLPKKGGVVSHASQLAKFSYEFLENLLKKLKNEYSEEKLNSIRLIQLENEGFHSFGIYKWRMSEEYLEHLVRITLRYLPHVGFLFSSSEFTNAEQIMSFFNNLLPKYPYLKGRLVCGYNYFYKVPKGRYLKGVGHFDSVTYARMRRNNWYHDAIPLARSKGYQLEITEAQTEPWPPIYTPGNSSVEFRFMLGRCMQHVLDMSRPSVIRIWGIEGLALQYLTAQTTKDHEEILELIQLINRE